MGRITHRTIANFIAALYEKQAEKYGGDCTLNELRVIAFVYQTYSEGQPETSLTKISEQLRMPRSTVHRAITSLLAKGWLREESHPEDGRRRLIKLSDKAVSGGLWQQGIAWIEQYSEPDD